MRKSIPLIAALTMVAAGPALGEEKPMQISKPNARALAAVLDAQPDETKARYKARHPARTLGFFGIAPGMTVVEALPGGGWYSKILIDYLGADGHLIGVDYEASMWPKFGFFSEEFIEAKKTWTETWTAEAEEWRSESSAPVSAFVFGSMPGKVTGTADAVLFIRALHNLNRFESDGGYLSTALTDAFNALKPGGVLGVVQHQARPDMPDAFADGSKGYLKKAPLIAAIKAAGFKYEGSIDVNENQSDQPGADDIVWRLPPTLITSREDPAMRKKMQAIGESNRMTLKFRKPK